MLTVAFRYRPGNTEWQYKTVISTKSPERWLADRLESLEVGTTAKLDACVLYAREITDEDAASLERVLEAHDAN